MEIVPNLPHKPSKFSPSHHTLLEHTPNHTWANRLSGSKGVVMTSGFKWREWPGPGLHFHIGNDFGGVFPCLCLVAGKIIAIEKGNDYEDADIAVDRFTKGSGFGNFVTIESEVNNNVAIKIRYAHFSRTFKASGLMVGDTVPVGTELGLTGSTGLSFGAHLHMDVRLSRGVIPAHLKDDLVNLHYETYINPDILGLIIADDYYDLSEKKRIPLIQLPSKQGAKDAYQR